MKRTAQRSVSDFCFIPHPSSLIPPHMTPADKLAAEEARRQFALEVSQEAGAIDVARAALLIAAEEEPGRCDVARCLARLDELGAEARARIRRDDGPEVEALNRYLFDELGFAGDQASYHAPGHSLVNT